MSKGGGGGGSTTTVQKADPWVGLQPALSRLYSAALGQFETGGPNFYPGSTIAPTNPDIERALALGEQRANTGSPLIPVARGQTEYTMHGGYLDSNPANATLNPVAGGALVGTNAANPYLQSTAQGDFLTNRTNPYLNDLFKSATDPMVEQFKNAIAPGLASQFSAAGRSGSGAHLAAAEGSQNALARGLAGASASIFGGAYEAERGRQQGAMGLLSSNYNTERAMQLQAADALTSNRQFERTLQTQAQHFAPQLAAADYNDIEKLMGVGQYRQAQTQDFINADRQRFDFGENRPFANLQMLNQLLQGGTAYGGSTSTQNQSLNRNPFASALGGASLANSIGGALGGNLGGIIGGPWGLLGGALLGGLFG